MMRVEDGRDVARAMSGVGTGVDGGVRVAMAARRARRVPASSPTRLSGSTGGRVAEAAREGLPASIRARADPVDGMRYHPAAPLASGQAVRRLTLDQEIEGSNPSSPASSPDPMPGPGHAHRRPRWSAPRMRRSTRHRHRVSTSSTRSDPDGTGLTRGHAHRIRPTETNLPCHPSSRSSTSSRPTRRRRVSAVDDISFDVHAGELFAFLGPNGAGKTTTISILTTTLAKTSEVRSPSPATIPCRRIRTDSPAEYSRGNLGHWLGVSRDPQHHFDSVAPRLRAASPRARAQPCPARRRHPDIAAPLVLRTTDNAAAGAVQPQRDQLVEPRGKQHRRTGHLVQVFAPRDAQDADIAQQQSVDGNVGMPPAAKPITSNFPSIASARIASSKVRPPIGSTTMSTP